MTADRELVDDISEEAFVGFQEKSLWDFQERSLASIHSDLEVEK